MNTPIYDAMRKELRQRVKARLFHRMYGANIPDSERPLSTDYDWPFSSSVAQDELERTRLFNTYPDVSRETLEELVRRTDLKDLARLLGRSSESWHYVHRDRRTMPYTESSYARNDESYQDYVSRETSFEDHTAAGYCQDCF